MKKPRSPFGFSLIELLVVIAIIAILAALVLGIAGIVQQKAARSRTEAEIKALEAGLENYKADNGDYVSGTCNVPTGGNNKFLYDALSGAVNGTKVYME